MREPFAAPAALAFYHHAWSEMSLLSAALSSILSAGSSLASPPAGRMRPANDEWLRAYA